MITPYFTGSTPKTAATPAPWLLVISEILTFDYIPDKDLLKTEVIEMNRPALEQVLQAITP